MQRRDFLAASAAAALGIASSKVSFAQEKPASGRQFFELRTYHFASPEKQMAYEQFLKAAAIPAFNRAGIEPVGAFKLLAKDNPKLHLSADPANLWMVLPHNSMESVVTLSDRLADDQEFQKAGHAILRGPKSDPAYLRYDSTLLLAMEGTPKIAAPTKAETRLFELRTYESHNAERAQNKLGMFNKGEFQIFGRAGMPGIFFGGAIVGEGMPQLTYMIVHENPADTDKQWNAFFNDPGWKKLSGNSSYKDNVSKVIDHFLRPAEGSQI
ncbi:MAG TPA: NIPSNAP family protein [Tepidisphaeraceae bacterium]|nr:NIPSNAP family protein [Tepidisphaeraceae bacterium]